MKHDKFATSLLKKPAKEVCMPLDPEGIKECFDPNSKFCAACSMVETYEDRVLCHITHLEQDHGIRIITDEDGKLKIHQDDKWKITGDHISWILK
jgi:hypothetical protein